MSNHSATLRNKVQALKRRGTLKADQIPSVAVLTGVPSTVDDDYRKEV